MVLWPCFEFYKTGGKWWLTKLFQFQEGVGYTMNKKPINEFVVGPLFLATLLESEKKESPGDWHLS